MPVPDLSLRKYKPRLVDKANMTAIGLQIQQYVVDYMYVQVWQFKCIGRNTIAIWRPWGPSAGNTNVVQTYTYTCIAQYGLNLSLFVDQPTISNISNDKIVSENDTATITCTVDSIPQSIIRWIFETKKIQNKYDGSLTLNKINCLSMGRYTCQAVNMLGVDNSNVNVTVKCEYAFILHCKITVCNIFGRWITEHN